MENADLSKLTERRLREQHARRALRSRQRKLTLCVATAMATFVSTFIWLISNQERLVPAITFGILCFEVAVVCLFIVRPILQFPLTQQPETTRTKRLHRLLSDVSEAVNMDEKNWEQRPVFSDDVVSETHRPLFGGNYKAGAKPMLPQKSRERLLEILPTVEPEDARVLSDYETQMLLSMIQDADRPLAMAALTAIHNLGDIRAISRIDQLMCKLKQRCTTNSDVVSVGLLEQAEMVRSALMELARLESQRGSLVRASAVFEVDVSTTLLKPVDRPDLREQEELLRGTEHLI